MDRERLRNMSSGQLLAQARAIETMPANEYEAWIALIQPVCHSRLNVLGEELDHMRPDDPDAEDVGAEMEMLQAAILVLDQHRTSPTGIGHIDARSIYLSH